MTRLFVRVFTLTLVLAACGGGSGLDEDGLTELRADNEILEDFTDEELRDVAAALCDAYSSAGEGRSNSGDLIETAWEVADVDDPGVDEIFASLDLLDAACPDALTPELAADSEPITMSFTLLGDDGDEYSYDFLSGCEGLGGYRDVKEDMLFNLTDEQGDVLGVARLGDSEETSLGCQVSGAFSVTFGELDDDTLYFVGDRAGGRGELAYTGAELRERGSIDLTLGDL